jgi:hypothetical protein
MRRVEDVGDAEGVGTCGVFRGSASMHCPSQSLRAIEIPRSIDV